MNGYAREDEERGMGVPFSDVERVMRHYEVDEATALYYLSIYPVSELLPERGYGLTGATDNIIGYSSAEMAIALNSMEDSMEIGQKAKIEICSETLPTAEDLEDFYYNAIAYGFHMSRPVSRLINGIPTTEFVLQKGSPAWAALIPIIVPVLIIGLITFGITKLGDISKALLPIFLVVIGGGIIIAGLLAKPAERVATAYITSGKAGR